MKTKLIILINAFKVFWLALTKPNVINNTNISMIVGLYEMIFKVVKEKRPYLSNITIIETNSNEKIDLVTIWAGYGYNANPADRIKELVKENEYLKRQIILERETAKLIIDKNISQKQNIQDI